MTAPKSRSGDRTDAPRLREDVYKELARKQRDGILRTARGRALPRREHQLLKQLMYWHNPQTGWVDRRREVGVFLDELCVSERTLLRARRGLIARGLITGYEPGNGHKASTYVIALSWEEADAVAAARAAAGDDAPYFPELGDRQPKRGGKPAEDPAPPAAGGGDAPPAAPPAAEEPPAPPRRWKHRNQPPLLPETPRHYPPDSRDVTSLSEVLDRQLRPEEFEEAGAAGAALVRAALRPMRTGPARDKRSAASRPGAA